MIAAVISPNVAINITVEATGKLKKVNEIIAANVK